jgi:hypothetical protein
VNVIPFVSREVPASEWYAWELRRVAGACESLISRGEISGCEHGLTETGDPQIYVLGPGPDTECFLCISRIGRRYVLEDGQGRVVAEHDAIGALAGQMRKLLLRRKLGPVGALVAVWLAIRGIFEGEVRPLTSMPIDAMSNVAPHLAALV